MEKNRLIALILAIVAFLGVSFNPFQKDKNKIAEEDLIGIVVAAQDIDSKSIITGDSLVIKKIHKDFIPEKAISSLDEVVGKVAISKIYKDDVLLPDKIKKLDDPISGLASNLKENTRAVTVNVQIDTGVHGLLKVGNRVDVISIMGKDENMKAHLLLENRKVLALNNLVQEGREGITDEYVYVTVTLETTVEEAMRLSLADVVSQRNRLILRGQEDNNRLNMVDIPSTSLLR